MNENYFENKGIEQIAHGLDAMGLNPHTWASMLPDFPSKNKTRDRGICFVYFEFNERVYIIQQATWSRPYALGFNLSCQLIPDKRYGSSMYMGSDESQNHGIPADQMIQKVKKLVSKNGKPTAHNIPSCNPIQFFKSIEQYNKKDSMEWHILKPIFPKVEHE